MPPGRKFVGANLRLRSDFTDDQGTLVNPASVQIYIMPPQGGQTLYVYDTDDEVDRLSTGKYYCDVVPNVSGRWRFRWEAADGAVTVVKEGNFLIDYSPHKEDGRESYGLPGSTSTAQDPYLWQDAEW